MSYKNKRDIDDDDDDDFDPKSKLFCRACVDISAFTFKNKKSQNIECPPDKNELGRATWTLLHSLAAYYPLEPSEKQKYGVHNFLKHFADLYPCQHCSEDFKISMAKYPPKLNNREELTGWLCMQHNLVNAKLGKPLFDCSKAEERWRTGWKDGSCDIE